MGLQLGCLLLSRTDGAVTGLSFTKEEGWGYNGVDFEEGGWKGLKRGCRERRKMDGTKSG